MYPSVWKKLKNTNEDEINKKEYQYEMLDDKYRLEMLKATGYYMTETSGHLSEYLPYFRKRKDLIKKFDGNRGWDGGSMYYYKTRKKTWDKNNKKVMSLLKNQQPIILGEKSEEYAPKIIHAIVTNKYFRFNGNLRNTQLITNLQQGACVEVPCFTDRLGIHPCFIGDLPPQCAALNRTNINVQELAVSAALSGDKELAYQAILMDPLTGAVLAPHEIRKMVNEMFDAEKQWLPQFNLR